MVTVITKKITENWAIRLFYFYNRSRIEPNFRISKNRAIWSNTVVEDAGMIVSTAQFWHRCSSGCEECAPPVCAVEADY